MRLPRVRFTVRRMMIAVAIVASLFSSAMMYRRYHYCLQSEEYFIDQTKFHIEFAEMLRSSAEIAADTSRDIRSRGKYGSKDYLAEVAKWQRRATRDRELATWHSAEASRMGKAADAFRRVQSRPWLAIPPEPE